MSTAPTFEIDPKAFWADPYPTLAEMRRSAPIAYVPQLDATLMVRRDDIAENEKKIEVFSSVQPDGLMTHLMGQNMMRKDGREHVPSARRSFRPFHPHGQGGLAPVLRGHGRPGAGRAPPRRPGGHGRRYLPPSGRGALCLVTGLTNMDWQTMDRVSQGMIHGCTNYAGDPAVEATAWIVSVRSTSTF